MPKDGLLWRTGILRGSLGEARAFYSGREIPLSHQVSDAWLQLELRIGVAGYSPYEYLFWVVNYMEKPFHLSLLLEKNRVCSMAAWDAFKEWKADANRFARIQMRLHIDQVMGESRIIPMQELLLNPDTPIGPVARVELALQHDEVDAEAVLKEYRYKAFCVLRGMPEFLEYAPCLKNYLEGLDASRFLFPA
jgi:hypothetical protein